MTDLAKTYPSIGDRGLTTTQSLKIRMAQEGGYYDSVKPSWCEPMRYQVIIAPTAEQLKIMLRDMPDVFDNSEPVPT
jgi:hypothetical protein